MAELNEVGIDKPSVRDRKPLGVGSTLPSLCFVGPMLSANPGWVTTQGEILAGLLAQAGYPVRQTSHIPARLPRLADTLRSLVAWRHEIDLVIHQVFSGPAFFIADAASALCRFFGLPQVFVLHGGALPEFATNRSGWVRRVIHRADAIIAPSGYLAGIFEDICSPGQRIDIIPNILSIEDYPWRFRPSVQPRLFWMRTFHPIYNPQMAIDVLAEVRHTHPKAVLTMAGQDKGQLAAVVAEAERKRLSDAVSFPGFLSTSAKNNEFNSHDIFLNTNRVDNMPVSVLEAMAYGLPVVATNVGGLPYLLDDGQTGLLVPDDDVAAMVGAVRRLLAEPGLAARLSTNGRQLAESCGWAAVRIRWEALFKEVLHA